VVITYSEEEVIKLIRQAFQAARTKRKAVMIVGYDHITGMKRKCLHPDAKEWFQSFKKT
jgi:isocitrate/isopropylmalate dehydrogenase